MPIPIYRTADRIGKPFIKMDPSKVVAILFSTEKDHCPIFTPPDATSGRIAEDILDFVRHEIKKGRMPSSLPWQAGVGDVANAILSGFIEDENFHSIDIYSEVLQDSVLDLIWSGRYPAINTTSGS